MLVSALRAASIRVRPSPAGSFIEPEESSTSSTDPAPSAPSAWATGEANVTPATQLSANSTVTSARHHDRSRSLFPVVPSAVVHTVVVRSHRRIVPGWRTSVDDTPGRTLTCGQPAHLTLTRATHRPAHHREPGATSS